MPTWRADYFDKARDQAPTRSVIIEAEHESDALDEARAEKVWNQLEGKLIATFGPRDEANRRL